MDQLPHIPSVYGFAFETATMLFIIASYILKLKYYLDWKNKLKRLYIEIAILISSIITFFTRAYLPNISLNSILFIMFLMYRT